MRISGVTFQISWKKPEVTIGFASDFVAQISIGLEEYPGLSHITGMESLGAGRTIFILPDTTVLSLPGGAIETLFERIKASGASAIADDELITWVIVSGEIQARGGDIVEEVRAATAGGKCFSDRLDYVLVATEIRFLSLTQCKEIEDAMAS